jgi:hypothetical protein
MVGTEVLLLWLRGARYLLAERGDLDGLGAEPYVRQPEAAADNPAVAEEPLDVVRMSARPDIEVLRTTMEEQIAYAATYEISLEVRRVKAIQDAEGIRIDVLSREAMFAPRDDNWSDHASEV